MCPNHLIATDGASCKYLFQRADPTTTDIRSNFALLERAVAQFDSRFALRALRSISSLRKRLTDRVLCSVIILTYSPNNATARTFIEYIGMDGEAIQSVVSQYKEEVQLNKTNAKEPLPEIDVYIAILIQVSLRALTPHMDSTDVARYTCTTRRSTTRVPSSLRSSWTKFGT
jgi:26S proteasome regulatory subunit N3